jgi:GT2 family glycosyltransferase
LAPDVSLRSHALLELAMTIAQVPAAIAIYADEDRIDPTGRRSDWRFKPAWSPLWLQTNNYLGHLTLLRRATVRDVGGWRADVADAQHDLLLRLMRVAEPRAVVHLAKLLAHAAEPIPSPSVRRAAPEIPDPPPRVSLIIPTRDGADVLATCIRSIRSLTGYPDYEIIIVDNGSVQDATKRLFAEFAADPAIKILSRPEPFNFSRLNNAAAGEATGSILALINNDIEVTDESWLGEMVALAVEPKTGCVGAKLLYPDGRLQHAGVVIGLGGVAGHAHRFARGDDPGYLGRLRAVHEVSAVTAACLVIRRAVFDAVGGLDEGLTVAFNDVDFCLKVRAAGYLNLWTPFAELIHHESISRGRDLTPAKAKRFADEYATMQRRWGAQLLNDPYYSPHLTYDREDHSLRLR